MPVAAFAFAVADFRRRFGGPDAVRRNDVRPGDGLEEPKLRFVWRNALSTTTRDDPSSSGASLRAAVAMPSDPAVLAAARVPETAGAR